MSDRHWAATSSRRARESALRVLIFEDDVTVETPHGKAIQQLEGFLAALARQQVLVLREPEPSVMWTWRSRGPQVEVVE